MNYMCLSRGDFFEGEPGLQVGKDKCPVCHSTFFVDNVIPDVPPFIEDIKAWQEKRLEELGI